MPRRQRGSAGAGKESCCVATVSSSCWEHWPTSRPVGLVSTGGVAGGSPTRFFELTGGGGRLLPHADSEPLGLSPQTSRFRLWSWETSEYRTEFHLFLQLKDPYLKENKDKGLWQLIGVDRNFRLFRCDGCPFARGLGRANSQFLKLEKKQGQNVGLLEVWQQSWVKSIPLST